MALKIETADFESSFGRIGQLSQSDLPEVAFSGRSNVGKSTLINKLLNRKNLARTSSIPGKTATINFFKVENDQEGMRLVDLPGYGYAKVSKSEKTRWGNLIEHYFDSDRDLRLVIQLVDMRHPPTVDDIMMLDYMTDLGIPYVVALTKADKLKTKKRQKREKALEQELYIYEGIKAIPFSSVTAEGVEILRGIIDDVSQND